MSKKLQDIYIHYGYFSTVMSLFLNQRTAWESYEMKNHKYKFLQI